LRIHLQWASRKACQAGEQGQECTHLQHPNHTRKHILPKKYRDENA
jgi:hypothetical protein